MIIIIISILLILFILFSAYKFGKEAYDDDSGFLWISVFSILGAILGLVIGCLILLLTNGIINITANKVITYNYSETIQSMEDNIQTQGNFFLGSGQVNGNLKYYYVTKEDNEIQVKSIDNSNDVSIIESDSSAAQIIHYKYKFTNTWLNNHFYAAGEKIKIVIPKGSIKYNFNMDLKN